MAIDIKNNKLGILLMLFVTLIVGMIFIGVLADTIKPIVDPLDIRTESVTMASGAVTTGQTTNSNLTAFTHLWNTTHDFSANLTTYNINWTASGAITANNESLGAGTVFANYTYEDSNYVRNSPSRVFIRLLIMFFAIFVFIVGYFGFMKLKEGMF